MDIDADRRTVLTVVVAIAAVLALGVAAATLDSTVTTGGDGVPSGGATTGDPSSPNRTTTPSADVPPETIPGPEVSFCVPWLDNPVVVWGIFVCFVLLAALGYWWTRSVAVPIAVFVAFGPPVIVFHQLFTYCRSGPPLSGRADAPTVPNGSFFVGDGAGAGAGAGGVSAPTALFGVLLFLALVGSLALLVTSSGDSESDPDDGSADESDAEADAAAVGRVAGEAADRIEDADVDVDNEIYRAWVAMTDHLRVATPRSSTPAEFAEAAVDAGMNPDDVAELTALFEAVRYGDAEPTAERESRAVAALRRIEAAYADENEGGTAGWGPDADGGGDGQ